MKQAEKDAAIAAAQDRVRAAEQAVAAAVARECEAHTHQATTGERAAWVNAVMDYEDANAVHRSAISKLAKLRAEPVDAEAAPQLQPPAETVPPGADAPAAENAQ